MYTVLPLMFAKQAVLYNPIIYIILNPMVSIINIMNGGSFGDVVAHW